MIYVRLPFGGKADKRLRTLAWVSGITLASIAVSMLISFVWLSFDPNIEAWEIYLSCIIVPMIVAPLGTMIGVRKQRLVEALAEENMRLANIDSLTGLPNRRAFMARAGALQENCGDGRFFACLIGDADDFKRVNDSHGHLVGDDVLSFLGKQLSALETDEGIVARLGGEEFAVAGVFDSIEAARTYGETLIGSIARQTFVGQGVTISVTISIGLAVDRGGEGISALLSRADKALYCAKADGKNCLAEAA